MKAIKFFLVALMTTAMMFSACNKDDDENEEPEVTPTPVVEEPSEEEVDAKLEKFDISNSQFGVANATETTISVEWKEDEVKFDSVKIELKKLVVNGEDTTFESVAKTTVKNDTKYEFTDLETHQDFMVKFNFYQNNKICMREYYAFAEASWFYGLYFGYSLIKKEVGGLTVLIFSHHIEINLNEVYTAYGEKIIELSEDGSSIKTINNPVYGFHLITNNEFEQIEKAAGISEEELSSVNFDERYGIEQSDMFRTHDFVLNINECAIYLNDDNTYCTRYFSPINGGIMRLNKTIDDGSGLIFVKD
jgi:hypothetical protein